MTSRDSADLPMSSSEGKEDSVVHADSGATDSSERSPSRLSGCLVDHEVWTKGCKRCEFMPPPEVFDAAIKHLRNATVPGLVDDDDCGYPLIDMLSDDGGTVASGIERAEEIACDIAIEIWQAVQRFQTNGDRTTRSDESAGHMNQTKPSLLSPSETEES